MLNLVDILIKYSKENTVDDQESGEWTQSNDLNHIPQNYFTFFVLPGL